MAMWDKLSSRGNVDDRRSLGPAAVGGLGLGGVALYLLANVLLGGEIDVGQVLQQVEQVQTASPQNFDGSAFEGEDEYEVFASTVLGSNNQLWERVFSENNREYSPPTLVLFRTATTSSCGSATSQVGPHYCPLDSTIYLDETFFDELQTRFGAQGGDVAEAYVIAHEVAHHVQSRLGILEQAGQQDSVQIELQADCLAGVWAYSIRDLGVLSPGEITEAMDAAAAVGDDRIQERVTGQINPESWTHGSSEARVTAFTQGYETGEVANCSLEL